MPRLKSTVACKPSLAAATQDQFRATLGASPGIPFTANTSTWASQAQYLVEGGVDPATK